MYARKTFAVVAAVLALGLLAAGGLWAAGVRIGLAWGPPPPYAEEVRRIKRDWRGRVTWSEDGMEVVGVYMPTFHESTPKQLQEQLQTLGAFPRLKELDLSHSACNDDDLRAISQLQTIETLHLSYTQVTPQGLYALERLPRLTTLSLFLVRFGCSALEPLERLKGLRFLSLIGSCSSELQQKLRLSRPDLQFIE